MIKREGFLIHRTSTSTEAYRLRGLLEKIDGIVENVEANSNRISNEEISRMQIVWESVKEMLGNKDLRDRFYFDIEKVRKKLKQYLGG